jgi:hypothetical protein
MLGVAAMDEAADKPIAKKRDLGMEKTRVGGP